MYHRKNGRTDCFMDISYYKCLLRKMNLFRPKNKLGCASGAGSGRKRGERGGGRWKPAEENEAPKVKNVNLNGQKAQEYEEM
jgi:hypothetical protein